MKLFQNKKLCRTSEVYKDFIPRCYWHKKKGKKCPWVEVKCGDCDESVEIYYDEYGVEVNGVSADLLWWRRFFMFLSYKINEEINKEKK